jgi:hypothetical protein
MKPRSERIRKKSDLKAGMIVFQESAPAMATGDARL